VFVQASTTFMIAQDSRCVYAKTGESDGTDMGLAKRLKIHESAGLKFAWEVLTKAAAIKRVGGESPYAREEAIKSCTSQS
jgi:hypothetical protein